jgi:signal transduction histidine kinase
MSRRLVVSTLACVSGAGIGALSLVFAHRDPGGSFAGRSTLGAIAELGAGWALILAAVVFGVRRPGNRFAAFLTAAGIAWFLPEWSNPGVATSAVFAIGLVGFVACPPLVAHAGLSYPGGRVGSALERIGLAFAYAGAVVLLGVLPTAVFDPAAEGCLQCPHNPLLVHGDSHAFSTFNHWGVRLGLGWTTALGILILWRLIRSSHGTAAITAPVLVPTATFLGLVAWDFEHSLSRGLLSNDSFDVELWRYEAAALAAVALGVAWGLYRSRRARAAVAGVVVELGRSAAFGGVRDALAAALGEPELRLAYRRTAADEYVDADGHVVELQPGPDQAVTPLLRRGQEIAALVHHRRLLDDRGLLEEVVAGARLAVENERFQAEVRAQLESLRASRARIVETGDAERRRLERDLHDGAQQRLVGLSLALRMVRSELGTDPDPASVARLDEAESELREALAELRELAHGIFPAALAEEGLAPAVEALAEQSVVPLQLNGLPDDRFDESVEAAAYFLIAEAVKRSDGHGVAVQASRRDGKLVVELRSDGALTDDLTDLEDRIGALDGRLYLEQDDDGGVKVRAELPCA